MAKSDLLNLINRKNIYENIEKNPGIHLSELIRSMDLSNGTIRYHLRYLEKRDLIQSKHFEGFLRYFIKNKVDRNNAEIIGFLRKKTTRRIISILLVYMACSRKELSAYLNKDVSTIHFHVKLLEKKGIIEVVKPAETGARINYGPCGFMKVNKEIKQRYYTLKDPFMIYDLFIKYKECLSDDKFIESIINTYDSMMKDLEYSKFKKNIIIGHIDVSIDAVKDVYFELFPQPFVA